MAILTPMFDPIARIDEVGQARTATTTQARCLTLTQEDRKDEALGQGELATKLSSIVRTHSGIPMSNLL